MAAPWGTWIWSKTVLLLYKYWWNNQMKNADENICMFFVYSGQLVSLVWYTFYLGVCAWSVSGNACFGQIDIAFRWFPVGVYFILESWSFIQRRRRRKTWWISLAFIQSTLLGDYWRIVCSSILFLFEQVKHNVNGARHARHAACWVCLSFTLFL